MGRLIGGNLGLLGFSTTNVRRTSPDRVRDALRHSLQLLAEGGVRLDVTIVDGLGAVPEVHECVWESEHHEPTWTAFTDAKWPFASRGHGFVLREWQRRRHLQVSRRTGTS